MAERVGRGQIWLYEFAAPNKRRPVVILSRQDVIGLLPTVIVAPITSTIRGAPSEVVVGLEEGLRYKSAVNLDHPQTVDQRKLRRYIGSLDSGKMREVCDALAIATGCDA
jgi:mRNA interferase MazF